MISMTRQGIDYWKTRPKRDRGDWLEGEGDWVDGYWKSRSHPHRCLILQALATVDGLMSVLECGANCGVNLALIRDELLIPENSLAGIDASEMAIAFGRKKLPETDLRVGDMKKLPWGDGTFDVVLCDAVLMYSPDNEIEAQMREIDRVTKKAIIIVDRSQSNEHIWGRDYGELLCGLGYEVEAWKLEEKDWPTSRGWQSSGYLWLASHRTDL